MVRAMLCLVTLEVGRGVWQECKSPHTDIQRRCIIAAAMSNGNLKDKSLYCGQMFQRDRDCYSGEGMAMGSGSWLISFLSEDMMQSKKWRCARLWNHKAHHSNIVPPGWLHFQWTYTLECFVSNWWNRWLCLWGHSSF